MRYLSLLISLIFVTPSLAQTMPHRCAPLKTFKDKVVEQGGQTIELLPNQLNFMRGIYVMIPVTPPGLPYGDKGLLVIKGEEETVVFVDGDTACDPVPVPKELIDLLHKIGNNDIMHAGQDN